METGVPIRDWNWIKNENELTRLEDFETGDWRGRSTAKGDDSTLVWPREVCGYLPMGWRINNWYT